MFSRLFLFVIGAVYVVDKVFAQDSYVAEVMIESNVTLDGDTILSILDTAADLEVTDSGGVTFTVTLDNIEIIAECLHIGIDTSCNCSEGYTWSNEVCYANPDCCQDVTCHQNVSHITPICFPKVQVRINGTAESTASWAPSDTTLLESEFGILNGLQVVDITPASGNIAHFEVKLNAPLKVEKLESILQILKSTLADVEVDITGLVGISAPAASVCYLSEPLLTCSFEAVTDSAKWVLSKPNEYSELNDGTVVELDNNCATADIKSCVALRLHKVTGLWTGDLECGFTQGSISFKARSTLNVTLLPDWVDMTAQPIVADCTAGGVSSVDVSVTTPPSADPYEVWWSYNGNRQNNILNASGPDPLLYSFSVAISCEKTSDAQYVEISFKNLKEQMKSERLDITVLYAGDGFCDEEEVDGDIWPNTPHEATVVHKDCPPGRTGYRARTCDGPSWQDVFNYCVDDKLQQILTAIKNFHKGLGGNLEVAMHLLESLKNTSSFSTDSSINTADVNTSITILTLIGQISPSITLTENALPVLLDIGSNMLSTTWTAVNDTVLHNMAADYLDALETLMERIKVNTSTSIRQINKQNLNLQLCFGWGCNVTAVETLVSLNKTYGISKVMQIKNLMPKLENTFMDTNYSDLLVSATVDRYDGGDNSQADIWLDFPLQHPNTRHCVFWNTTDRKWSDLGCVLVSQDENRTVCMCNHLTSFSVLMSKGAVSNPDLSTITTVGLAVSLCSLVALLIIEFLVWAVVTKSNLSYFRHTSIVNISTFRLLADICFLASSSPKALSDGACLALTICKHLFYLAMFCWMLSLSAMLVHQLIFVFSPLRKRVFMFLSGIAGYMFPIVIVASSYVYYKYTEKPYYDQDTCWLVFESLLVGSVHAFLIPVAAVILTNVFSLVVVVITLVKTSAPDPSKADEKEMLKSIVKVIVLLAPLFGVTWIIGFFLFILDNKSPMFSVANYAFTILNSFQGLFILIGGCIAEPKVREELFKMVTGKSKGSGDSSKNLTSTTLTKDS